MVNQAKPKIDPAQQELQAQLDALGIERGSAQATAFGSYAPELRRDLVLKGAFPGSKKWTGIVDAFTANAQSTAKDAANLEQRRKDRDRLLEGVTDPTLKLRLGTLEKPEDIQKALNDYADEQRQKRQGEANFQTGAIVAGALGGLACGGARRQDRQGHLQRLAASPERHNQRSWR